MTKIYAVYDSQGKIFQYQNSPLTAGSSLSTLEVTDYYPSDTHYVNGGEVVPRPSHPAVDLLDFHNQPVGVTISLSNEDGDVIQVPREEQVTLVDPGPYLVLLEGPWPYQDTREEIVND